MALGMEVGLCPAGHIVLDKDHAAPLSRKGGRAAPNFRPMFSERERSLFVVARPSVCRL